MNDQVKKKNNSNKNIFCKKQVVRKGFTLLEMLIAMFIFSMVAAIVLGAYFDVFRSKRKTRAVQQDIEDARFALELMAKTIRMSSVFDSQDSGNNDRISIYDYSQKKCLEYKLDNGVLMMGVGGVRECKINDASGEDQTVWTSGCGSTPATSWKPMTTAKITNLNFNVVKSDVNTKKLGYVSIGFKTCYEDNCDFDSAIIQTSVSLRDYGYLNDWRSTAQNTTCP